MDAHPERTNKVQAKCRSGRTKVRALGFYRANDVNHAEYLYVVVSEKSNEIYVRCACACACACESAGEKGRASDPSVHLLRRTF
jgi:hypothetical protein